MRPEELIRVRLFPLVDDDRFKTRENRNFMLTFFGSLRGAVGHEEEPTPDHPNFFVVQDKQLRNLFITSAYSDRWNGPLDLKEKNDKPATACAQYTLTELAHLRIGSHDLCLVSYVLGVETEYRLWHLCARDRMGRRGPMR